MSHFTVMVIGDDYEAALAPYHEFECTGRDDEYIKDEDITEEMMDDYLEQTEEFYVDSEGNEFSSYDEKFYRDFTPEEEKEHGTMGGYGFGNGKSWYSKDWGDGKGYRAKMHYIPEGYTVKEKNRKDRQSFKEFCEDWNGTNFIKEGETPDTSETHKYGYGIVDEDDNVIKVIRRTNPNSKWDWYQVGGRWSGSLKLKPVQMLQGSIEGLAVAELKFLKNLKEKNPEKYESVIDGYKSKGEAIRNAVENDSTIYPPSSLGEKSWTNADQEIGSDSCDQTLKRYIDIDEMERPMREQAEASWDGWHNEGVKDLPDDNKEKQEWIKDNIGWFISKEEIDNITNMSREEYVSCNSIWAPYALIWEGKWYAKGEMGWFACSTGEESNWKGQFRELWKEIPDDATVTMVDAHI